MSFDGRWMAQIVVPSGVQVSATTNAGGPTTVNVTAGTYATLAALLTQLATDLNAQRPVTAGSWTVTLSTGAGATGKVTIAVTNGTYSLTWTSTDLRDLLGFTANIVTVSTATGANQARGLWMPDCPLAVDGYHLATPRATDLRLTESPTGFVIGIVGNIKFRHRNIRYTAVRRERVWLAAEITVNESLERFLIDTQWGQGHVWFTPASKVVVIAHDSNQLGNASVAGWYAKRVDALDGLLERISDTWDGLWRVVFPELGTDS
jgi:hypothetical protein